MANLQLIVGLGNPGPTYANTRHNAGAWWINQFCQKHNVNLKAEPKFHSILAKTTVYEVSIYCLIPLTFMNLCGQAVASLANYYHIAPHEILIIHDDLDLAPGTIRLKTGGGHGGHNGIRDIMHAINSQDFNRLKIGIGHPGDKDLVSNYVLHTPSQDEQNLIDRAIDHSLQALEHLIHSEWAKAMTILHQNGKKS